MPPDHSFQHIVITRYFVRFSESPADVQAVIKGNQSWLESRFEIFKAFCLPSVVGQSVTNFTWLLYFDVHTPQAYLDRVQGLIQDYPNIKIVLCEHFNDESRARAVHAELKTDTRWLLTTRLDNDDGWHRDFVKALQSELRFEKREFLNFPVGILYYSDKTLLYRHSSNAFISLLEPAEGFLTVWCGQHTELDRVAPIRQLPAFPAFMQVVHPGTRSNKPRGMRVHRLLALAGFEAMRGVWASPGEDRESDRAIALYNVTLFPLRSLRDSALTLVRRLLDKVKPRGAPTR
jgi:hypothetical protein